MSYHVGETFFWHERQKSIPRSGRRKKTLVAEIQKQEQGYTFAALLENYTESHATSFLSRISENMEGMDSEALKDLLSSISVGVIPRSLLRK